VSGGEAADVGAILRARAGEIAVIGLGRSGTAAARLLARAGHRVYASDASETDATRAAQAELREAGIAAEAGKHDLARIAGAILVVVSPGVPPAAPPLAAARDAGVPIVSEIEIAVRYLPGTRAIAVTGTNGKTTTTAIVGHLLRALGHDAPDAGNIGLPLAEVALRMEPPSWLALELSSFQLHDTPGFAPTVGVVTNLSPDHLDRYASVDEYYADKARLFANASAQSRWVLNGDQQDVLTLHRRVRKESTLPGEISAFSVASTAAPAHYDRTTDTLVVLGSPLIPRQDLNLLGDHNVANALAASLAVMVADATHRTPENRRRIAEALGSFRALKHRMEQVGEYNGVAWINDSKATNVSSARVAVEGMRRPYVLLLGGRHKGEPYTSLAEPFRAHGKVVLAYGESAPIIERDLAPLVKVERMGSDFAEVIRRARELSRPGDAVLLSPACSSFDMFSNYEERGATFGTLAAGGPK
jgi:UDP-N-acetylmuramoylalanine--D-glutamate ligase